MPLPAKLANCAILSESLYLGFTRVPPSASDRDAPARTSRSSVFSSKSTIPSIMLRSPNFIEPSAFLSAGSWMSSKTCSRASLLEVKSSRYKSLTNPKYCTSEVAGFLVFFIIEGAVCEIRTLPPGSLPGIVLQL